MNNLNDLDEAVKQMEDSNAALQNKVNQLTGQFNQITDDINSSLPKVTAELETMNQKFLSENEIDVAKTQTRADFELTGTEDSD